jgi:ATP-dependent Lhr-like helicase
MKSTPSSATNAAAADPDDRESVWEPLVDEFRNIIQRNTSTLLFANSRRLCEKLTLFINSDREQPTAYAHHGSLSREIRETVERKLKEGALRAIVATSSLELGSDVGALDEVVLVQSPTSVSSAIQRVGRAGHQVGETSRGTLFPTHSHDFLEAAVLASAILSRDIEEVRPVDSPLDVLAQVIISMVGIETWDIDELFHVIKCSHPYRELARNHFDLVLNMLAGRYAHSRVRELKPRVYPAGGTGIGCHHLDRDSDGTAEPLRPGPGLGTGGGFHVPVG